MFSLPRECGGLTHGWAGGDVRRVNSCARRGEAGTAPVQRAGSALTAGSE